ncbi:T-cell leukemia homeobox protein 2-like [Lagopus leucura]|uniref:T-cell leukemia homeobox protein 2-like n=1 Tax=Lagopus leucura TaxID=30410 RepID=UPI001C663642|nr:T-cell leukemia homeobox protein 2-like [Lagopus leucura]
MKGSLCGQRPRVVQKKPTGTDTDRTETTPSSFQPRTNSARADTRTEPFRTASARRCGARRDSRRAPEPLGAVGRARRTEALPGRGSELRRSRERRQHGTERRYPERSGRGAPNGRRSGTRGQPRHRTALSPAAGGTGAEPAGSAGAVRGEHCCAGLAAVTLGTIRLGSAARRSARPGLLHAAESGLVSFRSARLCPAGLSGPSPVSVRFRCRFCRSDAVSPSPPAGRDPLSALAQRPTSKKRRKSRTAFSNQQLFELERRFVRQKYLSPADRDQLAQRLALSSAQVITWFQNRRAKLKRDLDEMRADVASLQALRLREPPPAPPGPAELSEEEIDVGA